MTHRDLLVALLSAAATYGTLSLHRADDPVMRSTAFEWNDVQARPTQVGEVRSFFRAPTATLDELALHVTTLLPGRSPHPPHTHPEEELIIIRSGTVESNLNGEARRLGPGSVIFQASNEPHSIRNVGEEPATYHVIKWRSPGMEGPEK